VARKKKKKGGGDNPTLATNRAARHNYHLLQTFECGIALTGTEVKSARAGKVNLKEGYARVQEGEVFLHGVHISPYTHGGRENPDPLRVRKLLLHAREIRKLVKETSVSGVTIVPTRMHLKNGFVKVEIALAKGKRQYDKRESKREQEVKRELARAKGSTRQL
jgi:SsrA-binding protein